MKYKIGDIYNRSYELWDETEGGMDTHYLYSTVVYADEKVFIVFVKGGANAEMLLDAIPLKYCIRDFPDFSLNKQKIE